MREWQPIETAPKGTFVLIVFTDGDMWVAKQFDADGWVDQDGLDFGYGYASPTHWMPLPPPPVAEKEN